MLRRTPAAVLALLMTFMALPGCTLTQAERSDLVAQAAATAGELAYQKVIEAVTKKLDDQTAKQLEAAKAAGATADQLAILKAQLDAQTKTIAEQTAELARQAAIAGTKGITDKALPAGDDAKANKTGTLVATILGVAFTLLQGATRKGLI